MTKPVRLYMRVEHQNEICIGTAAQMSDIPRLLEEIAALFRGRFTAERLSQSLADPDGFPTSPVAPVSNLRG